MAIFWKNIDPQMQMLGALQQYNFNVLHNLTQTQINNVFVPTMAIPSENMLEFKNSSLNGFRLRHVTALGDTTGALKFQSFLNNSTTGTDFLILNQDGTVTINANFSFVKLGIGIPPTVDGSIQFVGTDLNMKISLFNNNTPGNTYDQSGFGYVAASGTMYHAPIGKPHLFFMGTSMANPVQMYPDRMMVNYTTVGDSRQLVFKENANNAHQVYGFRMSLISGSFYNLHFQLPTTSDAFRWNAGTSSSASNNLMLLNGAGTLKLGTNAAPPGTNVARVEIAGGIQNVPNEDTGLIVYSDSLSAKIQLWNNAVGGHSYEFKSNSVDGSFHIAGSAFAGAAHISRFIMSSSGNIAIGIPALAPFIPNAPLQFGNYDAIRKIVLREDGNNDFQNMSLGTSSAAFYFNVSNTSANYIFNGGTSSSTIDERLRIGNTEIFTSKDIFSTATLYGKRVYGLLYTETANPVTAVTLNTWTKVGGTTTAGVLNHVSMPANNKLQYDGAHLLTARLSVSATVFHNTANAAIGISIYQNGTRITPSIAIQNSLLNEYNNLNVHTIVSADISDFFEVYCSSTTTCNITFYALQFSLTAA